MQTLPNIDININVGNSLISRLDFKVGQEVNIGKQLDIDSRRNIVKKYKESVKKYIVENDKNEKNKIKEIINDFNEFYIHPKVQKSLFEDLDKEKELERDLYENSLEWALQYPEIINEKNEFLGFDCIIGNPPYIQLQSMGDESMKLQKMNYEVYTKTGDIYCLFFELAKKLVKKDGIIAYITSNKWMRAGYGENLRKFLNNMLNPILLVDFGGIKIFDEATVDTNILILENSKNNKNTFACNVKENCINNLEDYIEHNKKIVQFDDNKTWVIISDIERSIKEKIEQYGTKLSEWDISINYGIKTGYNEAFIIDEETKNKLICEDPKSAEIIRPILRGRDIKRYSYDFQNLWLIYIPWHFPLQSDKTIKGASKIAEKEFMNKYPAIYNHLLARKEQLKNRNKSETGIRYEWYALQRYGSEYSDDFYKQKIVYPETTQGAYFCLDENQYFIDKTCFMITGDNLKFLLGNLSSSLFEFAYKHIYSSIELGKSAYQYNKHAFVLLPIINPSFVSLNDKKNIENLVELLLESNKKDKYLMDLDNLIYKLYNISNEEIEFINSHK